MIAAAIFLNGHMTLGTFLYSGITFGCLNTSTDMELTILHVDDHMRTHCNELKAETVRILYAHITTEDTHLSVL